ncbi:MAG: hypothetical protein K0U52_00850 [Gammaproteobacteria bacterium]|nr:hypothetical protein [Gammaproteobacteria bacterium]
MTSLETAIHEWNQVYWDAAGKLGRQDEQKRALFHLTKLWKESRQMPRSQLAQEPKWIQEALYEDNPRQAIPQLLRPTLPQLNTAMSIEFRMLEKGLRKLALTLNEEGSLGAVLEEVRHLKHDINNAVQVKRLVDASQRSLKKLAENPGSPQVQEWLQIFFSNDQVFQRAMRQGNWELFWQPRKSKQIQESRQPPQEPPPRQPTQQQQQQQPRQQTDVIQQQINAMFEQLQQQNTMLQQLQNQNISEPQERNQEVDQVARLMELTMQQNQLVREWTAELLGLKDDSTEVEALRLTNNEQQRMISQLQSQMDEQSEMGQEDSASTVAALRTENEQRRQTILDLQSQLDEQSEMGQEDSASTVAALQAENEQQKHIIFDLGSRISELTEDEGEEESKDQVDDKDTIIRELEEQLQQLESGADMSEELIDQINKVVETEAKVVDLQTQLNTYQGAQLDEAWSSVFNTNQALIYGALSEWNSNLLQLVKQALTEVTPEKFVDLVAQLQKDFDQQADNFNAMGADYRGLIDVFQSCEAEKIAKEELETEVEQTVGYLKQCQLESDQHQEALRVQQDQNLILFEQLERESKAGDETLSGLEFQVERTVNDLAQCRSNLETCEATQQSQRQEIEALTQDLTQLREQKAYLELDLQQKDDESDIIDLQEKYKETQDALCAVTQRYLYAQFRRHIPALGQIIDVNKLAEDYPDLFNAAIRLSETSKLMEQDYNRCNRERLTQLGRDWNNLLVGLNNLVSEDLVLDLNVRDVGLLAQAADALDLQFQ